MLMVQSNAQLPMKTTKVKGPPPVPPRPNQNVVAEALAKTRKAVAESRANFSRTPNTKEKHVLKAKTLERTNSTDKPNVSPKQNGLARVKSFIRDVISDRSSSSDERKSSGQNSRRSSSDSSSIPTSSSFKKSNDSINSKAVKTCKQLLIRSLSSSNKLDQDVNKSKVIKSSSFADKTLPVRKAPPPPLSPKPKIRPTRPSKLRRPASETRLSSRASPQISPYSSPIDAKLPPKSPQLEAPYATVDEVQDFDDRLRNSPSRNDVKSESKSESNNSIPETDSNYNTLERKTSRVTEMLISEIIASRNNNNNEANSVIDKGKETLNNNDALNTDVLPKDMNNHELLIYELQTMKSQSDVPVAIGAKELIENTEKCESDDSEPGYAMSSVSSINTEENSEQAYAYILDDDLKSRLRKQFRAISTMSLQGLPPLPKSLSGFADPLTTPEDLSAEASSTSPPTDLNGQLAYLKKEMASLRQLDLSLLSELWTLSEAMASWRRQLERGPRLRPAPPPPPPPHYLRT